MNTLKERLDVLLVKKGFYQSRERAKASIMAGIVYVDGLPLEEPYIQNLTTRAEGVLFPLIVEEGCIFVLGDNREVSKDSRHPEIGLIDTRQVLGKAIYLMLPGVDEWTETRDFSRTGAIQ